MDWFSYLAPFLTAAMAVIGTYVTMNGKIIKLETKIDVIERKQDKHNNFMERLAILEKDNEAQWHRIDDLKEK